MSKPYIKFQTTILHNNNNNNNIVKTNVETWLWRKLGKRTRWKSRTASAKPSRQTGRNRYPPRKAVGSLVNGALVGGTVDVRWSSSDRTQGARTNPCSTSKTNDSWENEGLVLDHQLHLRAGENELHGVKGQVAPCSCISLKAKPHTIWKTMYKVSNNNNITQKT